MIYTYLRRALRRLLPELAELERKNERQAKDIVYLREWCESLHDELTRLAPPPGWDTLHTWGRVEPWGSASLTVSLRMCGDKWQAVYYLYVTAYKNAGPAHSYSYDTMEELLADYPKVTAQWAKP